MTVLDKHQFEILCPECGKKFKRAAGRLNAAKSMKCPGCGGRILLNKKNFALLDKANAMLTAVAKLRGKLAKKPS